MLPPCVWFLLGKFSRLAESINSCLRRVAELHTQAERFKRVLNAKRMVIACLLLVALCALATGLWAVRYIQIKYDTMRYGMVANSILKGEGMRSPIFYIYDKPDAAGTIPYTVQPPIYPLFLATFGGLHKDRLLSAQVYNIIGFAACCVLTFLITRRLAGNGPALAAALITACSMPLLLSVSQALTEQGFIAFLLLAVWLLLCSRISRRPSLWLIGAGLAGAGAILTRWSGLALVGVFGWEALRTWRRKNFTSAVKTFALSALPLLVCFGLMSLRGAMYLGNIRGYDAASTGRSLWEAIAGMGSITFLQFGFIGFGRRTMALLAAAAVMAALFIFSGQRRKIFGRLTRRGADMPLIAGLCYFALFVVSFVTKLERFETRFAAPMAPLMVILTITVLVALFGIDSRARKRTAHRVVFAVVVACCCLLGLYDSYSMLPKEPQRFAFLETRAYKWLKEECRPGSIIATNRPFHVSFFTPHPAMCVPSRIWNPYTEMPEDIGKIILNKMDAHSIDYIVLVAGRAGLNPDHYGPFLTALSRRQSACDRLELLKDFNDGVVFIRKKK